MALYFDFGMNMVALIATAIAAFTDTRTGHIYNWLTFPLLVAAPIVHGVFFGWAGVQSSVLGMAGCFALPYLMFRQGGMGGGDVKLFAAIGSLVGIKLGMEAMLASMIVGTIWTVAKLLRAGRLLPMLKNSFRLATNWVLPARMRTPVDTASSDTMRLGASIFLGTACVLAWRMGVFQGVA